jgi:Endonuclease/Exonuclease/phosphatase family
MSGGIAAKFNGTLLLLLILSVRGYPQDTEFPVRIMFYNVENLFDTTDDSLTDDDEFLPSGLRRWNYQRYNRKINSLYKTIIAAGWWDPPAIAGFCEIENRKVVEDLVFGTYLSKYRYTIVHEDSPDERGIDVCLIYRKDIAEMIDYCYFKPSGLAEEFRTRKVLYSRFIIAGDTIHLFINHWPSRRGGVLAGEDLRTEIARAVRSRIDSLFRTVSEPKIIVVGDFNATPDDQVTAILTSPSNDDAVMVNLSGNFRGNTGTYRYMGTWEMIDQVFVSEGLINCRKGISADPGSFRIFSPDFLLKKDQKFPGMTPFSTYSGYRYQGGYSDHLPVLLDLRLR